MKSYFTKEEIADITKKKITVRNIEQLIPFGIKPVLIFPYRKIQRISKKQKNYIIYLAKLNNLNYNYAKLGKIWSTKGKILIDRLINFNSKYRSGNSKILINKFNLENKNTIEEIEEIENIEEKNWDFEWKNFVAYLKQPKTPFGYIISKNEIKKNKKMLNCLKKTNKKINELYKLILLFLKNKIDAEEIYNFTIKNF